MAGPANFFGNDSLLIGPIAPLSDTVFWVSVTGLDGVAHDSIRISAPGGRYFKGMIELPGTPWFIVGIAREASYTPKWELRVIDRRGRERDRTTVQGGQLRASTDAIWLYSETEFPNPNPSIVRIPVDAHTGRISNLTDTIYSGPLTGFDVTGDGRALVVDEGITETAVFVMSLGDALRGAFGSKKPLLRESAPLSAWLFPNGQRLLVERDAKAAGGGGSWLSTLRLSTGIESPMRVKGTPIDFAFQDSVTVGLFERDSSANHGAPFSRFLLEDARTDDRGEERTIPDAAAWEMRPVPGGGWVWLGSDLRIHVQLPGDTAARTYPLPSWYNRVETIALSPDGRYLALMGWKAATADSTRLTVLSLADGVATPWVTMFAEDYWMNWLADGSFEVILNEPQDTWTIYRIHGPKRIEKVGVIPGAAWMVTTSMDLSRVAVLTRDYRGTVWMFRVVHG
jgi:hypothetical protein